MWFVTNRTLLKTMTAQFDALVSEVAAVKASVAAAVAKIDELGAAVKPVEDLSAVTADLKAASDALNLAVANHTAPVV
jgi:hypothetical protein